MMVIKVTHSRWEPSKIILDNLTLTTVPPKPELFHDSWKYFPLFVF